MVKPWQWAALGGSALLVWWLVGQLAPTGGFNQPASQPKPDDDIDRLTDSGAPHCHPEQHHHGYTYIPHRYPRSVGGDITAVIHRGFSTMRIPHMNDVQWMIAPPSEAMW